MNKDPDTKITLLLPTKNEAVGVRQVIESVHPFVDEILVIDGHSTDGTADIAREAGACVVHDNGKGKGAALRLGIAEASPLRNSLSPVSPASIISGLRLVLIPNPIGGLCR